MLPLNNKPGRLDLFRKDLERLNNLRDGNNRIFALNSYLNFELAQLHLLGMKLKDLKDNIMKRAEDDRIRLKEKWPENPRLCNNSLFGPLGLRSNLILKEVPLTNALAWLITPHKGSQMHAEMLIALLELSLPSVNKISLADISDWKVNAEHLTEISEDDRGRIDIYINGKIESNIYQIAIEAKVGAIEGKNQLDKYEK